MFAPLLKLRDKLTRKRHSLTEDTEKPFLEHLDDLRKTLSRIIITLVIAVIACFVFHKTFFELVKHPLRSAGLLDPRERALPAAVLELHRDAQQPAWWRIHGAARGMADLEGAQRETFIKVAAPDAFTRQFAHALLFYHVAEALPKDARDGYIKTAAALLPAEDSANVIEYAAQLTEAETPPSLEKPHGGVETEAFAPAESFMLSMKLSLFAGIIVSFPLLFYFLLEFILPGLTSRERKLMFPALSIGFGLFLIGVFFAFFFVIPRALEFFTDYSFDLGIKDRWRIGLFISFVVTFCLIFGLAFELPVVVMVMVKLGLLTSGTMRRTRGWAVIIILVASAILTPTGDAFTMSLLGAPMIIMYEACIWMAWFHERKERRREVEEQRQDQARRAALIGVASVQAARGDAEAAAEPSVSDIDAADSSHTFPDATHDEHPPADMESAEAPPPHAGESASDSAADYEQYLRDHAHLYSPSETHPESVSTEERMDPHVEDAPAVLPDEPAHAETTSDIPSADGDKKQSDPDAPGPM